MRLVIAVLSGFQQPFRLRALFITHGEKLLSDV